MSRLFKMLCPWQKVTEYTAQTSNDHLNIHVLKDERFGTCCERQCPFFDNITENCTATKTLTTLQR